MINIKEKMIMTGKKKKEINIEKGKGKGKEKEIDPGLMRKIGKKIEKNHLKKIQKIKVKQNIKKNRFQKLLNLSNGSNKVSNF